MNTIRLMVLGIFILSSSFYTNIFSQDTILKTNGDEITAKVLEVTPEIVKYNKFDYLDGPIYSLYIKDITKIIYANGNEDTFNHTDEGGNNENVSEKIKDTFIDERDGKEYKIVKIGDRWWMAENLKYKTPKGSCLNSDSEKCQVCGYHYNFYEARVACPYGWHLPTDDEWMKLEIAVGMTNIEARKSGWRGTGKGQARELLIDGKSGFDIELCGKVGSDGYFTAQDVGFYWTSSIINSDETMYYVWGRHFKLRESINRDGFMSDNKLNIRCIKDNE